MLKLARHATLRQLQVFEAIARLKSVSRAAEELFLTQSTVSTQMKNLSDVISMPLVEYVGKQLYLTPAGELLYGACKQVFHTLDNVDMAVSDLKGLKKGTLSLSVISTAKYFAPEVLGKFWQLYPDIDVALNVLNREQVLERLKNNADDLYILGHNPMLEYDIHAVPFAPNPLYVMASNKHPLAKQKVRMSIQELAEHPLILREAGSGIRSAVENLFAAKGLKPNIRMVFSNNEAIKHAVIGQLGLSVLSLHTILLEGAHGPVCVLDVEGFPIQREWNVVHPKGKELSVVAKSFLEFLHDEGQTLSRQLDQLIIEIENGGISKRLSLASCE